MNKRLLLSLYDRSGLGAYMPVDFKGHELQVEEHMEKFAQLIVRECAGLLEKEAESSHDEGTETYNLLLKESKWMKQHFGVE